ncbi:MAG: hypothetical protein WDM78_07360 [Puia sp.]
MQALTRTIEGSIRAFVATKKQAEILGLRRDIVEYVKDQIDHSLGKNGVITCLICKLTISLSTRRSLIP